MFRWKQQIIDNFQKSCFSAASRLKSSAKIVRVEVGRNMEWDYFFQYITDEAMIRDMSIVVLIIVKTTRHVGHWCENSLLDGLWEDARC